MIGRNPNILITGTPGVGKSTLCQKLQERTKMVWRDVSKVAEEHNCFEDYDNEYQCPVLNEDKLLDVMEGMIPSGGNIVDYFSSEVFPERWFDGVFVLRANTEPLHDRLIARGYSGRKLEDNIQCEIFGTMQEEAEFSYKKEIITVLENNEESQLIDNVNKIIAWIEKWREENI